jgi:hypothetical protein
VADDLFTERYGDLLTGDYDCVDRIVLNAYFPLGHGPGGFRTWWRRLHDGSDGQADELLDNTHLIRLAGRFARRVKAWGAANGVPVIYCKSGERKHRIAEEYLATHAVGPGVFLILAAKAPAPVWKVKRSAGGVIINLQKKTEYVNHYSFHIMDPQWGHLPIKMSGHPPFGAQIILNGHEYVACAAQSAGIGFTKEGNCFHRGGRPAWPGSGRRCLVATSDCRAPEPGLRSVDLFGLPVLRAGPCRAGAQRLRLRLTRGLVKFSV